MEFASGENDCNRFPVWDRQQRRLIERRKADIMHVDVGNKLFRLSPGVYRPSGDTELLVQNVAGVANGSFLDIGCGCGAVAVHLASRFKKGLAVDINHGAIADTTENLNTHRVENVDVRWSNVFSAIEGTWDAVCFNGPYNDAPLSTAADAMFWDPGHRSKAAFFRDAKDFVAHFGLVYFGYAEYDEASRSFVPSFANKFGMQILHAYTAASKKADFSYRLYVMRYRR